jgi:hypothetical protein
MGLHGARFSFVVIHTLGLEHGDSARVGAKQVDTTRLHKGVALVLCGGLEWAPTTVPVVPSAPRTVQ